MQTLVGPVSTGAAVAVSGEIADAFAEQAKASRLDIVDTETFKDDSSTSFINQPTKAMRKIKIEGLTGELTWNDKGQVEKPATAYGLCDPGRQVHRRLSAYTSRPAGRFIQGKDACNRTETLLSHNKVAKLHKPTGIRRIMDKWAKQKKS